MIQALVRKLFRSRTSQFARKHQGIIAAINSHAAAVHGQPADRLAARLSELRGQADNGAQQADLLPEVFSLVREAADQALGLRHFDAQLLGGLALSQGMVAEMKTGEGKTLAATLPTSLAAVFGQPAHVVTVNDYLATRDAEWMGEVYATLGLSVGTNVQGLDTPGKKAAYAADVTYGTNNQFGFDYLNDNMIREPQQRLQRGLGLAIVDEVDSILIDEARTPLAISGIAANLTPLYQTCNDLAQLFQSGTETGGVFEADFAIDERTRQVHFSDAGYDKAEQLFTERGMLHDGGLYDAHNLNLMHHLVAALRARHLYTRDRDYVVNDGKVIIVDEHTGRLMAGRRWGDGMHQAIEAKEGTKIEPETQTLASISLQNFYRLYERLAGMTGTALTEAEEFSHIYGLEVAEIPTHRSMIRKDQLDRVFARREAKLRHVVVDVKDCQHRNQPVLVGTTSIDASEELSALLTQGGITHDTLNAKQHQREAEIIAQAGMPGKVTISTSMAGRGTDIVLGGALETGLRELKARENLGSEAQAAARERLKHEWQERHDAVVAAGGLRIIGTERHESRRIDNQLRGRSGRQGDPGSSVFYLSFEDPLLRVFTDQKLGGLMERLMAEDDEPLEVGMVSRVIEKAQRRVEGHYFDIRKQLCEYDDIANDQRQIIYEQRRSIVDTTNIATIGRELASSAVEAIMHGHVPLDAPEEEWDIAAATTELQRAFGQELPLADWLEADEELSAQAICERATQTILVAMADNLSKLGEQSLRFQTALILEVIDTQWREHLAALDHLRLGIGMRGFAQKNPKQEYRREALGMFNSMLISIRHEVTRILLAVRLRESEPPPAPTSLPPPPAPTSLPPAPAPAPPHRRLPPILPPGLPRPKRNDPCPCGSGKKFKHCHGRHN